MIWREICVARVNLCAAGSEVMRDFSRQIFNFAIWKRKNKLCPFLRAPEINLDAESKMKHLGRAKSQRRPNEKSH